MRKRIFLALLGVASFCVPAAQADFWAPRNSQNLNPLYGTPGAIVQPGQGRVNPYYYQNLPGTGYYRPGYNPNFFVGPPAAVAGGYFSFRGGGNSFNFWKAPSGYYYPWCRGYGVTYPYGQQILVFQTGASNPTPAQPPLTTVMTDMRNFLDDSKAKEKLSEADYQHLSRRLNDIQGKYYSTKISSGGTLDEGQEADVRKEVDLVGEELTRRLKT
jgi:hypothetical protein